ncbi:NVEALA domain-containing protein [Petrimonas sp.]|uniref:NVEALA domain-containing protein n=1 Tax=Petrimonas sp. TaxID=2023866 RepID=UPI003F51ABE0
MSKKTILSSIFAIALVVVAGLGINKSVNSDVYLSDLALANVEALAQTETGDEFYAATGCHATIENISCTGKNGKTYSYAYS